MLLVFAIIVSFAALSMVGWLAIDVARKGASAQVDRIKNTTVNELADAFIFVDFKRIALFNLLAIGLTPVVVWLLTGNLIFAGLSMLVPIIAPKIVVNRIRKKRLQAFRDQLPDALIILSSSLRAGASLTTALENLMRESKAPLSEEFGIMMRSQRLGMSFEDSLKKMEERVPLQELFMFSAGMRISREVGGNLSNMLDSLADTMYRTMQTEGKINSLTSQGKMQGYVMTGLPILLMLVLNAMEPKEMAPLFHTPAGWATLGVIAVMEILGYLGISKITNINV